MYTYIKMYVHTYPKVGVPWTAVGAQGAQPRDSSARQRSPGPGHAPVPNLGLSLRDAILLSACTRLSMCTHTPVYLHAHVFLCARTHDSSGRQRSPDPSHVPATTSNRLRAEIATGYEQRSPDPGHAPVPSPGLIWRDTVFLSARTRLSICTHTSFYVHANAIRQGGNALWVQVMRLPQQARGHEPSAQQVISNALHTQCMRLSQA